MAQFRPIMILLASILALAAGACSSTPQEQAANTAPGAVEGYGGLAGRVGPTVMIVMPDGRTNVASITDTKATQMLMQQAVPLTSPAMMMVANGQGYVIDANSRMPNGLSAWDYFKKAGSVEGYGGAQGRVGNAPVMMAMMPDGRMMSMRVNDAAMAQMAMQQGKPLAGPAILMLMGGKAYSVDPDAKMPNGQRMIDFLNNMVYGNFGG